MLRRGEALGLPPRLIARELVATLRSNVTIGWMLRANVQAHRRVLAKRILREHGYPLNKQENASRTVLEQAEGLSRSSSQHLL